jgi:hypothetical protein
MLGFSNSTANLPMSTESQLRDKLRKIALFAGAGTAGERLAAEAALGRVRQRLAELGRQDPSIEMQFSMPDQWSHHLFLALCRPYGLKLYRHFRQRHQSTYRKQTVPERDPEQISRPKEQGARTNKMLVVQSWPAPDITPKNPDCRRCCFEASS